VSSGSVRDPGGQHHQLVRGPTPVRFGLVAIAGSLVAHVGLVTVLRAVEPPAHPERVRATPTTIALTSAPARAPVPIDLALVALPAPALVTPPVVATAPQRVETRPRATVETSAGLVTEPAPIGAVGSDIGGVGEPGTEPGTRSGGPGILAMRRDGPIDLSPRHVAEGLEVSGGVPPPPRSPASGELAPSGNGTFSSQHGGFGATVARDGSVKFKDTPAFSVGLRLPNPKTLAKNSARQLETWFDDPGAAIRAADRNPNRSEGGPSAPSPVAAKDLPPPLATVPIIGGAAELTDWIMRRGGIDPYASAKRDYLERTRDERAALRQERDAQLLARSVQTIRGHLTRAWARADLDAPARRRALFELWDDCVEDGDEEVVGAGNRARAAAIGFVRAHLPAGSPDAFTPAEIIAFNRTRTSRATFAPY